MAKKSAPKSAPKTAKEKSSKPASGKQSKKSTQAKTKAAKQRKRTPRETPETEAVHSLTDPNVSDQRGRSAPKTADESVATTPPRQNKGRTKEATKKVSKADKALVESSAQPKEQPVAEKKKEKDKKQKRDKKRKRTLADKADKFICYQKSVQCPEHDVDFFEQAYRDVNHRKPLSLREDFCGTFAVCCDWVTRSRERTAVGVDLCPETLQWGREHNLSKIKPEQQSRIRLLEQDVRVKNLPPVDVLAAQNFSFWIFQTRPEVITYLRAARENLKPGGIMILDMMGGADCYREGNEDKKVIGKGKKKFHYFWKQVSFNPANNRAQFAISFRFRDGSKLENAFEYDWRFWSIPEVREMLTEAGFSSSRVYFENEEDDSIWEAREHAPSHSVWLAYIVAVH